MDLSQEALPPELLRPLRATQLIVAALVAGVILFGGVIVLFSGSIAGNPGLRVLAYAAAGFTAVAIIIRKFAVRVMLKAEREKIARQYPAAAAGAEQAEHAALGQLFLRSTIVGTALLEGSVMFNLVTFLLVRHPLTLLLAVVVIAGMAMQFPTRARFEQWLAAQRELLAEQRVGS